MVGRDKGTSENKSENSYPVKSVHNFLLDVRRELGRSRTASLIGVVACLLILVSLIRFAARLIEFHRVFPRARVGIAADGVIMGVATISLLCSVYALYGQGKFFKRWGGKFELLEGIEKKLLDEKNGKSEVE